MSEPIYMQGDTIATTYTSTNTQEVECQCGNLQEIDVEEFLSHGTTTWYGEWTCTKCNDWNNSDGWY
jgi:uncharacterized ParB-like nuclease family protein